LKQYQDEIFYLGNVYGSKPLMPMWLRHFGKGKGGLGEAYHIGVFGKTGSGKSFLSSMIMAGYAKHPKMSIFVLDPQGEFSNSLKNQNSNFYKALKHSGKGIELFDAHNLVLIGYEIFKEILKKSKFLESLTITYPDNKIRASEQIVQALKGKLKESKKEWFNEKGVKENEELENGKDIKPWDAYKRESFNVVWKALRDEKVQTIIYPSKETRERLRSMVESGDSDEYYKLWAEFARLFSYEGRSGNNIYIKDLIKKVTDSVDNGPIVIINLSKETFPEGVLWNEEILFTVIKELLKKLQESAEQKYKEKQLLNTLVILDEAHRFVPREQTESESLGELRSVFIDAIRTTRKYGLGWMFISQTLASLHKEILKQLRIYLFGFGLGWGTELDTLKEIIGGNAEAIKLYQSFRDPQSSIGQKQYPFMGIGPISPLSFSGTPLFFIALDYETEFFGLNGLIE
jgi:DNA helicase HerA-like ATPase